MTRYVLAAAILLASVIFSPRTLAADLQFRTVAGAGGVPLNVVTSGDPAKPAILFIHGIGASSLSWQQQLDSSLADEFYLVAFDLRGHANSGKPWEAEAYTDWRVWAEDVDRVMQALTLDRPVLVGWSYGTLVVCDYVRQYGTEKIRGIVLTGAYGGLAPPPTTPPPTALLEAMQRNRVLQLSPNPADNAKAARFTARLLTAKVMPPEWYEQAAAIGVMLPVYARRQMFNRKIANADLLPKLRVPVLFAIGGEDGSMPASQSKALIAELPKAVASVYPKAGHSPFLEDPDRFNAELRQFAQREDVSK